MKKKEYESPTMQVVQLKQQCQILAGSNSDAGVESYEWNDVDEE